MFPDKMISSQKLEEMIVDAYGDDGNWITKAPVVIGELIKLRTLNALHFDFPDVDCFESFIKFSSSWKGREWRSFTYMIGVPNKGQNQRGPTIKRRDGYLTFAGGSDSPPSAVKDALQHADAFELLCHTSVSNLSEFRGSMKKLRSCRVSDCMMIDSIFVKDDGPVETLEELYLLNLEGLKGIWKEPTERQSLQNLKFLHFVNCKSLAKVFTVATLMGLPKLEELHVESCEDVVEIIGTEEESHHGEKRDVESKLKTLVLAELPNLTRFYKEDQLMVKWVSLEKLQVSNCSRLKAVHLQKLHFSGFVEVRGNMEWWSSVDWTNESVKKNLRFKLL
ncbi:hypothetical protein QJS04_geneDACA014131 [Acorus gramineus]|uniref:Disease resistance protein At4g27190-like leucine-rich repeats domain-containing protein n=1 Tax=Acorus gramineus TaxID=55184 RepID=A0AAV9B379_ACOGR|nr:hypothetical protein QJS04_geneDACA014131 [Acorus gramineus]